MRSYSECASVQTADIGQTEHLIVRIQQELQLLLREREAIVKRIGVIKHTLAGLTDIFGSDIVTEELRDLLSVRSAHPHTRRSHPGLTETCRRILMGLSQPITARQLCGRIEQENPSVLERNKNPTASVAVVLRRLVSYREVLDTVNERDGRTWLWVGARQHDFVAEHQLSSPVRRPEASKESSAAGTEA